MCCLLMIRRPPRSTQSRSSAASDVYKRQLESSAMLNLKAQDVFAADKAAADAAKLPNTRAKAQIRTVDDWSKPRASPKKNKTFDGNKFGGPLPPLTPVSYTHLRAHETVLDLVCRLLLEKKKHRKTLT
eukprot:TRINITY_DN6316_c0_g1_i1.p1 TRINITY_DN6316_c0_g1~~TRINITY_DN6316_c0_g1_i1.p1  ORF type:complete len:129 (+),score=56.51 TRINITY_DN6316_c0_g1_i1:55-441(+)